MFADKDVDVSVEELKKVYDLLKKKQSGELSDDELESIAGGMGAIGGIIIAVTVFVAFETGSYFYTKC